MDDEEKEDIIIKVLPKNVSKDEWMLDSEGQYRFQRVAIPTISIDPATGKIQKEWNKYEEIPGDNSSPVFTVTYTRIKIVQVYGDADMANVAGDRTIQIIVGKNIAGSAVLADSHVTSTVTLTQNQNGSIYMPNGSTGQTYLNDNGTVSAETTSVVGTELEADDTITFAIAGAGVNAGDRLRLQVYFEVLEG
jgi:hypothetical protein